MARKYDEVGSCPCDLSFVSIREAIHQMRASESYDLFVHPDGLPETIEWIRRWCPAGTLAPQINIHDELTFRRFEWCLENDSSQSYGSRGAP